MRAGWRHSFQVRGGTPLRATVTWTGKKVLESQKVDVTLTIDGIPVQTAAAGDQYESASVSGCVPLHRADITDYAAGKAAADKRAAEESKWLARYQPYNEAAKKMADELEKCYNTPSGSFPQADWDHFKASLPMEPILLGSFSELESFADAVKRGERQKYPPDHYVTDYLEKARQELEDGDAYLLTMREMPSPTPSASTAGR